jgi:catechol 2,3-dioxygenase-like lactoylglutathione lyase family enzyme
MKISSISSLTCVVKDLKRTIEFYEALGMRLGKQEEDRVTFYVNWFAMDFIAASQPINAEYQREALAMQAGTGAGIYIHIKVENADEFYEGVIGKGMTPDGKPEGKASTGRSFILRDPDGYKLVLFEKK